jgi:YVTN family beta-propeller protein
VSARAALIVATSTYRDTRLRGLVGAAEDARALASVLQDPQVAGFDVTVLLDEPHHVVGEAIGRFYRDRRRHDLALLYFTGHGIKDDDGRLYFAMTDTNRDSPLFTALSADHISYAMEMCPSRQKVLVLDCCYSGAFPDTGSLTKDDAEVHALERFEGRGRAVLTASDATQYAFEGEVPDGGAPQSLFTHYMVRGLRTGEADLDGDGDICLDDLYSYVHDHVTDRVPHQRPKKLENVEGRIVLGRNTRWCLPPYIQDAATSPIASQRLAAVEGLAHLHRIGNEVVRARVTAQIRELTQDDSRTVAAAANSLMQHLSTQAPGGVPRNTTGVQHGRPPPGPPARAPEPNPPPQQRPAGADRDSPRRPRGAHARTRKRRRRTVAVLRALLAAVAVVGAVVGAIQLGARTSPTTPTPPDASVPMPDSAAAPGTARARRTAVSVAVPKVLETVAVGDSPSSVVFAPDGRQAYVGSITGGYLTVIRTADRSMDRIAVRAGSPRYIAFMRRTAKAYVSLMTDAVAVVDTRKRRVVGVVRAERAPYALSITPDDRQVFVPDHDSEAVTVVRTADDSVATTFRVKRSPHRVVFSGDGRLGYLANHESNLVTVLRVADRRIIAQIPVGAGKSPHSLAISPDGRRVYTTNYDGDDVSVIDVARRKVIGEIEVGDGPQAIAFAPDGNHAYVVNNLDDTISAIDTRTRDVVRVRVGDSPTSISVAPDGRLAYVSNFRDDTVSLLSVGRT